MGQNYQINQFGEIVQEDYFFRSVRGDGAQILPSNRKVWKIWLLCLVTLGIYSIVFWLAMGKETNVACKEDGKHTRGFWGTIGLSIITLGIYAVVWICKWLNREYSYLQRHNHKGILSGSGFLLYFFIILVVDLLPVILLSSGTVSYIDYSIISIGSSIILMIIGISLMVKYIHQHNMVCRIYNDINNLVRKA